MVVRLQQLRDPWHPLWKEFPGLKPSGFIWVRAPGVFYGNPKAGILSSQVPWGCRLTGSQMPKSNTLSELA